MRLLTIGRDATNHIVLADSKVSALHAELVLLDNGDMLLTDRNSTNGTLVRGQQVQPGVEVSVRRGDSIMFAGIPLDWKNVPTESVPADVRGVYGIGSHSRNSFRLSDPTVSRFHATLKVKKNGKVYICDHSKNGTLLNGVKIPANKDVPLKRSDALVCGKSPVDVKSIFPKSFVWGKVAAALAVLLVIGGGLWWWLNDNKKPDDMIRATTLVVGSYYHTVVLEDDPFVDVIKDWPREWYFGKNCEFIGTDQSKLSSDDLIYYTGTAFFISRDGKMGTNRHVAVPWSTIEEKEKSAISQQIAEFQEQIIPLDLIQAYVAYCIAEGQSNTKVLARVNAWVSRFKKSALKFSGKGTLSVAYPDRNYNSFEEMAPCTMLRESDNAEVDLAIIQLNDKKTPDHVPYIFNLDEARLDPKELRPQVDLLYTIGYPAGLVDKFSLNNRDGGLKPTFHNLRVSKVPGDYDFQFQSETVGGASGSPVFDEKCRLVGVVNGKWSMGSTYSTGCHAKYLKELYEKTL